MLLFHLNSESLRVLSFLNQMIRLITFTIGGRAYLNFMGNEFGHPEVTLPFLLLKIRHLHVSDVSSLCQRVEFPTQSNNFSFSLANRRWDLLESGVHHQLLSFDKVSVLQPLYKSTASFC